MLAQLGITPGNDSITFYRAARASIAVALEPAFGKFAPVLVPGAVVEHPAPAGVFPRRRADVNALDRQEGCLVGQLLPVEGHGLGLSSTS